MLSLLRARSVSPTLIAMCVFEICFWIAITTDGSGLVNAHEVAASSNEIRAQIHETSPDSAEAFDNVEHFEELPSQVDNKDTILSKQTMNGNTKPVNQGHQSNMESVEKDGAPQETSEDGNGGAPSEENNPSSSWWTLFWMVVAAMIMVYATPAIRDTISFGAKLKEATTTDRYSSIDSYNKLQDDSKTELKDREKSYAELVSSYYDLATEFYEWGWGQSFHFAERRKGETFHSSILRHEHYIGGRLGVNKGAKILDCGCGVGGPARNISEFTEAHVTGITINAFQVRRGNQLSEQQGASDRVTLVQGDFMKLPFPDNHFDGVYAIEATCHAPDRMGVYSEIFRVLKPGAVFATYEWCLTDHYDKENAEHRWIKKAIEEGDGLPDMCHTSMCTKAVEDCGFELLEARDAALADHTGGDPWYRPLTPTYKPWVLPGFQFNPVVFRIFPVLLSALEAIRIVPAGTSKTQVMLLAGGIGCERGGDTGVFTPMWLMVGRKPATAQ